MDSITTSLSTSTLDGKKFKIQQTIPSGSVKKGPHVIVRSVDLNKGIQITRRCGEGSKPLFARDDIAVNKAEIDIRETSSGKERNTDKSLFSRDDIAVNARDIVTGQGRHTDCKTKTFRRSCSTESSSPERYRHRDVKKPSSPTRSGRRKSSERSSRNEISTHNRDKHSYNVKHNNSKTDKYKEDKHKRRGKSKSRSASPPIKKKTVEKVPYYRDEQREKDRLKRLYGRSRSPPPTKKYNSPFVKKRVGSPPRRRRSTSRERHYRNSPHSSFRRNYRSRRSRSRSRTRSPSRRERLKHFSRSSREREKEHKEDPNILANSVVPTTPQFIPIPVAVPADYAAYSFPGWTAPHPSWRPPPAPHFPPFQMMRMMPPLRPEHQTSFPVMPPYPPMAVPYRTQAPQRFAPPRHNTNYQSRLKKP